MQPRLRYILRSRLIADKMMRVRVGWRQSNAVAALHAVQRAVPIVRVCNPTSRWIATPPRSDVAVQQFRWANVGRRILVAIASSYITSAG